MEPVSATRPRTPPSGDGTATSASSTLTITVFGNNDTPVAVADTKWAQEDLHTTIDGNVNLGASHSPDDTHGDAPSGTFADGQVTTAGSMSLIIEDDSPLGGTGTDGIMANAVGTLTGDTGILPGGDGFGTLTLQALTSIPGITYINQGTSQIVAQYDHDLDGSTAPLDYFTITVHEDGTYDFVLETPRPLNTQENVLADFDSGGYDQIFIPEGSNSGTADFYFDGLLFGGAGSSRNFTNPNNASDKLQVSTGGFGIQNGNVNDNEGFMFFARDFADSLDFNIQRQSNGTDQIDLYWWAYTGNTAPDSSTSPAASGSLLNFSYSQGDNPVSLDPNIDFTYIVVRFDVGSGDANFRVEDFAITQSLVPETQQFNFLVTATDGDSDEIVSSDLISITLTGGGPDSPTTLTGTSSSDMLLGSPVDDSLSGSGGNDVLVGAAGADAIDGGPGVDTFVVNAVVGTSSDSERVAVTGNNNDTGQDTITGFDLSNETLRIVATNVSSFVHGTDTAIGTQTGGVDPGQLPQQRRPGRDQSDREQ